VAGLVVAGLLGTVAIFLTIAPTLGQQFGYMAEASTLFALLTYLGACAAALKYRVRGELTLAIVGGVFCIFVIGWSTTPVLQAFGISLAVFVLLYWPLRNRRYVLPDPSVRTGKYQVLRQRHDDPDAL
jgi:hypothetical protein